MLRFVSYDIVFQEIPSEVTLAVNLSGCPNKCDGCHSPHLQGDIGDPFDEAVLDVLLEKYNNSITCVCFMGGDAAPLEIERLAVMVKQSGLKTGWYSGRHEFPLNGRWENFDYVKLGPYIASLGGLDSETTNQRLYKIEGGIKTDITSSMSRKSKA